MISALDPRSKIALLLSKMNHFQTALAIPMTTSAS